MLRASNRTLCTLVRILNGAKPGCIEFNIVRAYVGTGNVTIGEIAKATEKAKKEEYVPRLYYKDNLPQTTTHHLRWIMQKDILGQDVFLIGPPGPRKRILAMQYIELTNREHEYVALSRDTTESDLKQRREIVGGTAKYFDQSAVKAAIEGRILVLEGVEKAERNVLPVLNNLLENREMHLEDGRLLIPADRYDKLLEEWQIELTGQVEESSRKKIDELLSCAFALLNKESKFLELPDFPVDNLPIAAQILARSSGSGKTMLLKQMATALNRPMENIVLYQDMTARDLIQQRTTLENGDTVWSFSPLIQAALEGKIAVLDGINRIHPSTLSVLHRLVHDRDLQLYDGKRLMGFDRYNFLVDKLGLSKEQLGQSGIFPIHPEFRIVAVGEPPNAQSKEGSWMSPEILSLFLFHQLRTLSKLEEMHVITAKLGPIDKSLHQIINLAHLLRENQDQSLKNLAGHLSTRQLIRIAARIKQFPTANVYGILEDTFMIKFLPSITRKSLDKLIGSVGIPPQDDLSHEASSVRCQVADGDTSVKVFQTDHPTKVPKVLFYDIPQHVQLMEKLLQDFQLGYHLLLVGNQGVGKNKIIDRFLELLNRPREYIQLHRDTTVQTLTTQPTVKDGVLIYEDSPLVKAIKNGHVLVVDEADKAPTHVTCILKTLVESGQMILSDGRRISQQPPEEAADSSVPGKETCIKIHKDFRMIVLANRPGFPFLGNDFFGALGDLFSSRAVENPSVESEIELLKQYGPEVPTKTIRNLVDIFGDLRLMADQGLLNYPYSTREVVNIIKHLQKFPTADVEDVVFNVFDFDRYSPELLETLGEVLQKHGFSKNAMSSEYIASKRARENIQVTVNRTSGLDVSAPKHGKEDPKNDPHVGGNTWAGGTGGRDTAGLGGKGGPYRLDKGHKVHQLSDEEKADIPEHVKKAAREMNRKVFAERLKEIGMSGYDHNVYSQFSGAVARQVQSLRSTSIPGLLGEKTIYKRRSEQDPEIGSPQVKPKYLRVLVDVSGSMYRFNGYDGRLDRELEAVVLVMEAFEGFEDKIKFDIIGHSGEEHNIVFVARNNPPKNNKERLEVIRTMHAHSQFCWSGDNTLEATKWAVNSLAEEDCDEAILVLLSDANLQRYGIPPSKLAEALTVKPNVSSYAVFIGSLGDQAERLTQKLPSGRAFICNDTKELPQILKQIFWTTVNV
ncbi:hypothetical protein HUJ04_006106 [Dendroctonus ponderosae]|nr:hypothetical protein HUJ04_006106 [Dendroctonus ponderosae]